MSTDSRNIYNSLNKDKQELLLQGTMMLTLLRGELQQTSWTVKLQMNYHYNKLIVFMDSEVTNELSLQQMNCRHGQLTWVILI